MGSDPWYLSSCGQSHKTTTNVDPEKADKGEGGPQDGAETGAEEAGTAGTES